MAARRAIVAACLALALAIGCRREEAKVAAPAKPQAPTIAAEEVLARMVAAYRGAETYADHAHYLRQTVRRDEGVERNTLIFNLQLTVERPNRWRFKYLREYPPSQRNETFDIASDGQIVRTAAGELPAQVHETLAPAVLTLENLVPEPNVREAILQVSVENIYPQLAMLLADSNEARIFPADAKPRHLDQAELRGAKCYRIALDNPAGKRVLWIDAESYMLLRMELPVEGQLPIFDPHGEFNRYAVLIDYLDPALNQSLATDAFELALPEGAARMRRFVMPPPPAPPAELGRPVAPFSFTTLDGEAVTPESLKGKVALLEFWAQNCPPCREHTPLLEKVYQELKNEPNFAFYAVNMDPASLSNTGAQRIFDTWGGTIPLLRDPADDGYNRLGIRAYPHMILLDPAGRLQWIYSGMHVSGEPILQQVRQLLAGENVAQQTIDRHAKAVAQYEANLKAAELNGPLLNVELVRPEVPARKLPEAFQMRQLWQSSSDRLRLPGDTQIVSGANGATDRLVVLDNGAAVVELSIDGAVTARHVLPKLVEQPNGFVRAATGKSGERLYAVSGVGWNKVHVFDDHWHETATFPAGDREQVGDVLFTGSADSGAPLLCTGYLSGAGVQGVSPEGRATWVNRWLDRVLQVCEGPHSDDDKRRIWCTSSRGTITQLAADGQLQGELGVVGQSITHLGPVPNSNEAGFCGIAADGNGRHAAVGFDGTGEVKWRYELPPGDYRHEIPRIHRTELPELGSSWLVVAADGSLHWLDSEGDLVARCDYGAPLTGIATRVQGGSTLLYLATASELTAWELAAKPSAISAATISESEPPTATPSAEEK